VKILHIVAHAHRGGCEKNCYHFIAGSGNYQHTILVLGEKGPMTTEWERQGVSIEHLSILQIGMFAFYKSLKKRLKNLQFDLVICWSTIRLPLQLAALKNITKEVRVHLGNPLNHNPLKDLVLHWLFPNKGHIKLMACSNYVANTYSTAPYYKQFAIQTSLNPIALPPIFPQKQLVEGQFTIGMVARLDPIKDHATVLKAFEIVSKQMQNVSLHLVGDGVLRNDLEQQVATMHLSNRVVFHGDVSNVYDYLNKWDVFVYATTPSEGLGSVVAEAMANGLPCILSDLPMLRELAPVEGLALFFEAGNAEALAKLLLHLLPNQAFRASMGAAAYQHAQENFGAKRFVKDYL